MNIVLTEEVVDLSIDMLMCLLYDEDEPDEVTVVIVISDDDEVLDDLLNTSATQYQMIVQNIQ